MSLLRSYGPAIVILVWGALVPVWGSSAAFQAIAALVFAISLSLHAHEERLRWK